MGAYYLTRLDRRGTPKPTHLQVCSDCDGWLGGFVDWSVDECMGEGVWVELMVWLWWVYIGWMGDGSMNWINVPIIQ
jgi:hypothetical protein